LRNSLLVCIFRTVPAHPRSSFRFLARVLPAAKPGPFPGFIEPMLATLGSKVPIGAGYVHEVKLDGYRVQAHLNDGHVTLYTRSGLDWTKRFPHGSGLHRPLASRGACY
jgi:ATP-dependent DNA ligase